MARWWITLALALLPALGFAQPRASRPPRPLGRLGRALAQGSGDEVILPVTELRVRRASPEARLRRRRPAICLHPPVEVIRLRGRLAPRWVGALTDCEGRPTVRALAALTLLAQPEGFYSLDLAPAVAELRRTATEAGYALADDVPADRRRVRPAGRNARAVTRDPQTRDPVVEVAPGVRVLHPRLLQLLQLVVDRFPGHVVELVSGYRPSDGVRTRSRHAHARALDFRLRGVTYEALRDFARTLPDAGVGYYPNSVFIHLDVRDAAEGRTFWVDYSGPGESPRYGHWPPTDQDVLNEVEFLLTHNEHELEQAREREGTVASPLVRQPPPRPNAPAPALVDPH